MTHWRFSTANLRGAASAAGFFLVVGAWAQSLATLPKTVKHVLFLGDSITYSGQYAADVEAYFVTRHPERSIEFINVGLPSETVSGLSEPGHAGGEFPRPVLSERLARVLQRTKPDFVFACYGMNDGIYMPFDQKRLEAYQKGQQELRRQVEAIRAKIVFITPPYYDGQAANNLPYQETLNRYSQWLLGQRRHGWNVIDVHGPMTEYIDLRRKSEPSFAYASDAIHPDDFGHWIMAKAILEGLGAKDIAKTNTLQQMVSAYPNGEEILSLVRQREELLKDAWLTATGHKRPGMNKGLPLAEAQEKAAEIEAKIRSDVPSAPRR